MFQKGPNCNNRRSDADAYVKFQGHAEKFEELTKLFEQSISQGWDGYNAEPVLLATFQIASRLLRTIPLDVPPPTFGAEPDGHITFEWHVARRLTLSISVSPQSELHYSALAEGKEAHGKVAFRNELPQAIVTLLEQQFRCSAVLIK